MLLSCTKSCDKVLLLNFEPEDMKVNESALEEMVRSWNGHLEHFLSDKIYSTYSSLFCFTETNINDSSTKYIDEILDNWKDIHKNTQHGLALCYNASKVNITEVIVIPQDLEILPIVLEIEEETFLLVIVYHMPGPLGSFIDDFIH